MKVKLRQFVHALIDVLTSRELRKTEVALLKAIIVAVGAKLGYDFSKFLGK